MGGLAAWAAFGEIVSKMMKDPRAIELLQKAQASSKIMKAVREVQVKWQW